MSSPLAINHNLMADRAANSLTSHYASLARSTERLSSGLRINGASDDASGLAVRELMRADISALGQGMRNTNDAISMLQTADGALGIIDEKLIRMKELAEQAATGTYDSVQRQMINSEFQQMASEIERIAQATEFNGIKILNYGGEGSSSGAGSDGNEYVTKVSNVNSSDINITDPAALGEGSWDFVITSTKYANVPGTNYGLSITSSSADATGTFNITWDGTTWNLEGLTREDDASAFIGGAGQYYVSGDTITYRKQGGGFENFTLEVTDANGNSVNGNKRSAITGKTTSANIDKLKSNSINFSLNTSFLGASLDPTTGSSESPITFTIDLGNGNSFKKTYNNAGTVASPKFTLTNKIKAPDEPSEIPDDVVKIHFGPGNDSSEDYYYINKSDVTLSGLGLDGVSIETQEKAQKALKTIDDAIVEKDKVRAYYGTMQNRLENTMTTLSVQSENLKTAESRISDADVAMEMMTFVKNQILTQSAVAMLTQANSMPQMAMQLIR